jgi:hypothetical protein
MLGAASVTTFAAIAFVMLRDTPRTHPPAVVVRIAELAAMLVETPGPMRALGPLLVLALPGLALALHRDRRTGLAMFVLVALVTLAALSRPTQALTASALAAPSLAASPLVALALVMPAATAISLLARGIAALRPRRLLALGLAFVIALGVAGAWRRHREERAPLRFATPRGVRLADVRAGEVPCDFLAWEHLSWECSHLDVGTYALSGLATSQPPRVGGREISLFLLAPTSLRQPRSATWKRVQGARALTLDWAVPDGERGGVAVDVAIDGVRVDGFDVPAAPGGMLARRRIATPRAAGRAVDVTITVRGAGLVGLDGGFMAD